MAELDVPAVFGLHWSRAKLVANVTFLDRRIIMLRAPREHEGHALGFVLGEVSRHEKFEARVTLYKSARGNKLEGHFFGAPDFNYRLSREPFSGDWPEVLALIQEVIAAAYDFPPALGMERE